MRKTLAALLTSTCLFATISTIEWFTVKGKENQIGELQHEKLRQMEISTDSWVRMESHETDIILKVDELCRAHAQELDSALGMPSIDRETDPRIANMRFNAWAAANPDKWERSSVEWKFCNDTLAQGIRHVDYRKP